MRLFAFLLVWLWATTAWAADPLNPEVLPGIQTGCIQATLCSGQTSTGVCTTGGASIVADVGVYKTIRLDGTQSSGNYTCDGYSNDTGYTATAADKQDVTTTQITQAGQIIFLTSGFSRYFWLECSTVATSVTITALMCVR